MPYCLLALVGSMIYYLLFIPIFISTILMDIEVFIIGRNIIIESIIAIVLVVV